MVTAPLHNYHRLEEKRIAMAESTQQMTEDLQRYGMAMAEYLEACRVGAWWYVSVELS